MSHKKHKRPVPGLVKGPAANKQNGLRAFRQNDFTTAIRLWSQIDLQNDPAMRPALAEAHFRRAVNTADPQSRLTDLQRAVELSPVEGRSWYHLGMAYHRADRLGKATEATIAIDERMNRFKPAGQSSFACGEIRPAWQIRPARPSSGCRVLLGSSAN